MNSVKIESLDSFKDELVSCLNDFSSEMNSDLLYADARLELSEGKGVSAQNGLIKGAGEDYGLGLGVRVYAKKDGFTAGGMAGLSLNILQLSDLKSILRSLLDVSFKRAKQSISQKKLLSKKYPQLTGSLNENFFAETKAFQDKVEFKCRKKPDDLSLEELIKFTENISVNASKINGIASNVFSASTGMERKIFASTENSLIDQSFPLTEAFYFIVAKGKNMESYYESLGEKLGLEVFDGVNGFEKNAEEFMNYLCNGTVELSNAKAMKRSQNTSVVTDSWFNSLLVHEICGHPVEADRALKREAAWAGRAWWFKGLNENMFGKKVASENITVFSDASLEGYGKFKYDDEGTLAKKSVHIDKGILKEFLNSRETAAILNQPANGGMRATTAEMVPLIRMNNTCFASGKSKAEELIEETRDGFYLIGRKTPSIGETRQNFKITAWKAFRIENGELKELYRMAGMEADSFEYLSSVDLTGNDFRMHNVPNCGKGAPIQVMKLGNGAPSLRGKAIVSGAHGD
ncbi:MAG: TldD/PmbA family protein [Candidatus Diapherotrites archaeon]|nr:TldD/PmbA family protein [Candidatus Diapherotrites archaeon]